MLIFLIVIGIVSIFQSGCAEEDDDEFGADLVAQLTADRNLDLPVDEEYEDLRAELLAYHTLLANMAPGGPGVLDDMKLPNAGNNKELKSGRRTLTITPCWKLGGICVLKDLCIGPRYLTEVPGCKNRLHVCCFGWNRYYVKNFNPLFKESQQYGPSANTLAIIEANKKKKIKELRKAKRQSKRQGKKHNKKKRANRKSFAIIIKNKSDY